MKMKRDGGIEGWMGASAQRGGGDGLMRRESRSPGLDVSGHKRMGGGLR